MSRRNPRWEMSRFPNRSKTILFDSKAKSSSIAFGLKFCQITATSGDFSYIIMETDRERRQVQDEDHCDHKGEY